MLAISLFGNVVSLSIIGVVDSDSMFVGTLGISVFAVSFSIIGDSVEDSLIDSEDSLFTITDSVEDSVLSVNVFSVKSFGTIVFCISVECSTIEGMFSRDFSSLNNSGSMGDKVDNNSCSVEESSFPDISGLIVKSN